MDKNYNPQSFEKEIYQNWLEHKYFSSKPNKNKKKTGIFLKKIKYSLSDFFYNHSLYILFLIELIIIVVGIIIILI